jgi:hypothetical protein
MADQAQRKIETLAVPRVTVIGHPHVPLLGCNSSGLARKKNLTEINHKVSVFAKWSLKQLPLRSQRNAQAAAKPPIPQWVKPVVEPVVETRP